MHCHISYTTTFIPCWSCGNHFHIQFGGLMIFIHVDWWSGSGVYEAVCVAKFKKKKT